MSVPQIFESEYRFCLILWEHEPVNSTQLVHLCQEQLGWSKATTYTVIRRLSQRGVVKNENAVVTSLVTKEHSVAFATHKATAMGSVQPMAGTTSRCTKAIICFLSASVIPYIFLFNPYTKIYGITNKYQSLPHFFLLVPVITK